MANSVDTEKNGELARDHSTTDLIRRLNSQFDTDKIAAEKRRADALAKGGADTEEKDEYIFDETSMTDEEKAESDEFKSLYEKYLGKSEQETTASEPIQVQKPAESEPEQADIKPKTTTGESGQKRSLLDMLASFIPAPDKDDGKASQASSGEKAASEPEHKPVLTEVENDLDLSVFSSRSDDATEVPVVEPEAEEPVVEEPVAEESVAEEPVAEEPVAEEPVAEEPVAEEPVAEEPEIADDTPVGDIIKLKLDDTTPEHDGETEAVLDPVSETAEESVADDENTYTEEYIEGYSDTETIKSFQPSTEPIKEQDGEDGISDDADRDTEIMMAFGLDPKRADKSEPPKKIFEDYPFSATAQTTLTDIPTIAEDADTAEDAAGADEGEESKPSVSYEYKSFDQTKEVFDRYKQKYSLSKLRIGIAAFFAAALLILECIPAIGEALGMVGFIIFDLALVLLCAFFAFDKLVKGVGSLIKKKPDGSAFIPVMLFVSFVTTLSALFVAEDTTLRFYNFTFALCILLASVASYIGIRKEIYTFNIISSKKKKLVLARTSREDSVEERTGFARFIEDAEVYRTREARFVDDFYSRKKEYPREKKIIGILLAASSAVSLIVFILSLAVARASFFESMTNMYFTMLMCAPASVLVSYAYAAYLASIRAYSFGAAIIGDTTPEEYEKAGVISFSDNVAFSADNLRIRSVKVFENNSIEDVIYLASSVYSKLGGPLATVFRKAALDGITADSVEIASIDENGAEAIVDGHSVVIGQPAYMDNQCYTTTYEAGDELYEGDTNKRILYLAKDNAVIAKFYLQYNASSDFIYIVRHLSQQGICTAVTTADPGIDSALLRKNKLDPESYPIKIIKPMMPQEELERVSAHDAGIVSNHDAKGLIKTLIACEKARNIGKTNLAIKLISMLVAAILTVLLVVTGNYDKVLPFYPALYQLFWMIPMYLVSKIYI